MIKYLLPLLFLIACGEDPQLKRCAEAANGLSDLQGRYDNLTGQLGRVQKELNEKSAKRDALVADFQEFQTKPEVQDFIKTRTCAERDNIYIVKFKLRQARVSLDLIKHAKDAMNALEFEMAVDRAFYDSVQHGSTVVDQMRAGSALLEGTWSSWEMTVVSKRVIAR